jgi:hypothetical protein
MDRYRLEQFNAFLEDIKAEFFSNNTPETASNEVASCYHFLPFKQEEKIELVSDVYDALESRFALLNKNGRIDTMILMAFKFFVDEEKGEWHNDINFNNSSLIGCLRFIVDGTLANKDFENGLCYGELLMNNWNDKRDLNARIENCDRLREVSIRVENSFYLTVYSNILKVLQDELLDLNEDKSNSGGYDALAFEPGVIKGISKNCTIEDLKVRFGEPDKFKSNESIAGLPASIYIGWFSLGIEIMFEQGQLSNIWLKNGALDSYGDESYKVFDFNKGEACPVNFESELSRFKNVFGNILMEHKFSSGVPYTLHRFNLIDVNIIDTSRLIKSVRIRVRE